MNTQIKIAIMQPYLFPYIGYFQLISAVDKFIFYDDVTFIKQGWINRNRLLMNGNASMFSVPLTGASSNALIHDVKINRSEYSRWRHKFMKTVEQCYRKAPQYSKGVTLLSDVIDGGYDLISDLAIASVEAVCDYLCVKTKMVHSSRIYHNASLKAQDRVIDICHKEGGRRYVNPIGGVELYSHNAFNAAGMKLNFIKSSELSYSQFGDHFVPWLSIIDVLMFNTAEEARLLLDSYSLVQQ